MNFRMLTCQVILFSVMFFFVQAAHALAFRAYLTPTGADVNPCTLQQPCRLLPAALAAVADGGEVWILDSGNYNTSRVNVAKSVTIFAVPGVQGSVVATGNQSAIRVAAPGVRVTLRNLVVVPLLGTTYTHGIEFSDGSGLLVDGCTIAGNFGAGISVNGPMDAELTVRNVNIAGSFYGMAINGPAGSRIRANITDTVIRDVAKGIHMLTGGDFSMTNSRIYGRGMGVGFGEGFFAAGQATNAPIGAHIANSVIKNFVYGVAAQMPAPYVSVSVSGSEISHNAYAISADTAGASVALSENRIVHNVSGVLIVNGATVFTSGNNYFAYNAADGAALTGPGGLR